MGSFPGETRTLNVLAAALWGGGGLEAAEAGTPRDGRGWPAIFEKRRPMDWGWARGQGAEAKVAPKGSAGEQ